MVTRSRLLFGVLVVVLALGVSAPVFGVVVSEPHVRFRTAATVDMGGPTEQPIQVQYEWLNADLHADLAVLTQTTYKLRTYLGNGEGFFVPVADQDIGGYAVEMIVNEFTGDAHLDYALLMRTLNPATSGVRIYEGDGAGGLTGTVIDSFGFDTPVGFAIAQNDTDSHLDLVVATKWDSVLHFLRNSGSGSMSIVATSSVGVEPTGVTSGYIDGDGSLDYAVTCGDGTVWLFSGQSMAPGSAMGSLPVGNGARRPQIEDLDGQHWQDIVVMNDQDEDVSVLLANGTSWGAGFTRTDYPVASEPADISLFRCDGDDLPDLAVARAGQGLVDVRLNDGSGGFGPPTQISGGTGPVALSSGDFDGDWKSDLIAADISDTSVRVLKNTSLPTVHRLAGADRYSTANEIAEEAAPYGATTVVLATGTNYPDALAGVPLAAAAGGPVLLTRPDYLPGTVASRIKALGATQVYVLGGENAISPQVVQDLTDDAGIAPGDIKRLWGADRYETCYEIAKELDAITFGAPTTAFVATGENFPDALAGAGPAGSQYAPILLVRPNSIPGWTQKALNELGITQTVVLGGEAAVSADVQASLPNPLRLYGSNRYATARAIADYAVQNLGFMVDRTVVATGENFPDALAAGPLCLRPMEPDGPMLLVEGDRLPSAWNDFVSTWAEDMSNVYIVGGTAAVADDVIADLEALY